MQKSKRKASKNTYINFDFQQCNICKAIFSESLETHYEHCSSIQNSDPPQRNFLCKQGYVFKNVFHAKVEESKGITNNSSRCRTRVLMHPLAMRLCKIRIGGYVIIQNSKYHNLYIAFPDERIKRTSIAFYDIYSVYFKMNESVIVYPYNGKVYEAETVLFSICDDVKFSKEDVKKTLHDLRNTFIYPGMISYKFDEDSAVKIFIKNVTSKYSPEKGNTSKIGQSLISDFSHMNLNDTKLENETQFYSMMDESVEDNKSFSAGMNFKPFHETSFSRFDPDSQESSSMFESFNSSSLNSVNKANDIEEYFYFSSVTTIEIDEKSTNLSNECEEIISFKSVGGLEKQKELIQNYFELFFESESTSGLPCGMIFCGPSGTGKTLLAEAVCNEFKLNLIEVKATDLYFCNYTNEENKLKSIYKEAVDKSPSVIFIHELDLLCDMSSNNRSEMINNLGYLMDQTYILKSKVLWLAKVTDMNVIDKSLKKNGRFEVEIKFGIPEIQDRKQILQQLLHKRKHCLNEQQINDIVELTPGFSGFLLAHMCEEAEIRRSIEHRIMNSKQSDEAISEMSLGYDDFKFTAKHVKPDALNSDQFTHKKIRWKDIGGMEDIKKKLQEVVDYPIKYPEVFKRFNIQRSRGILLYGPPGCSKTMIAKALATESCLNFIPVKGPELLSKWVGDSEKAVRDLFKRAKEIAPCIIFFDEIDALVSNRGSSSGSDVDRRVVTQLLTEMDGAEELTDVVVIAATNRPNTLDPAMLRPGRLDHLIYVPLPDLSTRKTIFDLKFKSMPIESGLDVNELVLKTSGYSGAEIVAVCHEAAFLALSENWPHITENPLIKKSHFSNALTTVLPRIPKEAIHFYELFSTNLSYSR